MGDHEAETVMLNVALLLPWWASWLLSNVMAGAAIEAEFMEAVKRHPCSAGRKTLPLPGSASLTHTAPYERFDREPHNDSGKPTTRALAAL